MTQYAVLGDPVQHSLSPRLFKLFAVQTGQSFDYQAIQVSSEALPKMLAQLRTQGCRGINLTAPLKEKAMSLADVCSERAHSAKAINMLSFKEDGTYYGDNSDGIGFIRDLVQNKKFTITQKEVLILGSGGAVRGLMSALLQEKPQRVVIYNRSEQKARQVIENFKNQGIRLLFSSLPALSAYQFDLVIQCTTLGFQGKVLPLPARLLMPGACCYDLAYGKSAEPFLTWAKAEAASFYYDGLGMLVEQAAEAFYLWRGIRVDTEAILHQLSLANTF